MGFLDNSGDIILDAVLTEAGRKRLAQGNGDFIIDKFALGDDEIDYSLYRNANNINGAHASGSGYEDLNILQTPIMEAFTNSAASLKSRLLSFANRSLLYLPVSVLNPSRSACVVTANSAGDAGVPTGGFFVSVDTTTSNVLRASKDTRGVLLSNPADVQNGNAFVTIDQGLNTTELAPQYLATYERTLAETQYMVEVDNQLLTLADTTGQAALVGPISNDQIATYILTLGPASMFFAAQNSALSGMNQSIRYNLDTVENGTGFSNNTGVIGQGQTDAGVIGTRLAFSLAATPDVTNNTYLFTNLGGTTAGNYLGTTDSFRYIDTTVRVTGLLTGYRMDIPLRLVKKV